MEIFVLRLLLISVGVLLLGPLMMSSFCGNLGMGLNGFSTLIIRFIFSSFYFGTYLSHSLV